jgi:hypothetical protein
MNRYLSSMTATAVLLGCVACSSSGRPASGLSAVERSPRATTALPPADSRAAARPTDSTGGLSAGPASVSAFCDLARRLGKLDLGVSGGNLDADATKLLRQVDQLDAIAPADLKKDFDVYTAFEHAVLTPGEQPQTTVHGDNAAALEHVAAYLSGTCGIE